MARIVEQYNDKLASVYDKATTREFKWMAAKEVTKALLSRLHQTSKILNIGIGTGQSTHKFYKKGHTITGIDISAEMLKIVNYKYPKIKTYQYDIEKGVSSLGLNQNSFNAVIAAGILEFIEDIRKFMRSIDKLLSENGYLCVDFENYIGGHKYQGKRKSELGYGLVNKIPRLLSLKVYRRTLSEVEKIFREYGFEIIFTKKFQAYLKSSKMIPVEYALILA